MEPIHAISEDVYSWRVEWRARADTTRYPHLVGHINSGIIILVDSESIDISRRQEK